MASYIDLKLFHPEFIKMMFYDIRPPERLYRSLFRAPSEMGLYEFSSAKFDDPFMILPPVAELEDAKSMFTDQGLESYTLQRYAGFVDISNKLIGQYKNANNLPGLVRMVQDRHMMVLREAWENTLEYTCFQAMEDKATTLTSSHDWTSSNTTADLVISDLVKARQAYLEDTRTRANTVINNPVATTEMLLRKDIANRLYTDNRNMDTGTIGSMYGLTFSEQVGGYKDFENQDKLTFFQPTTPTKNLSYVLNPQTFGYPVVFGAPTFRVEEEISKDAIRIYANGYMGFVYNLGQDIAVVERITV